MAVAVSSVRGKPKPRATTANFHRGASIWQQQQQEEEAPRGAATTSHTFSPPGLLAFPGPGKSSNPNVGEQSMNVSLPSQMWNCIISVPLVHKTSSSIYKTSSNIATFISAKCSAYMDYGPRHPCTFRTAFQANPWS